MPIHCEDLLRKQLNRNLTEEELLELEKEAKQLAKQARASLAGVNQFPDIQKLAAQWAKRKQLEVKAKARAINLQASALLRVSNYVLQNYNGIEGKGISALLVGSSLVREGARLSVDSIRGGLINRYLGGLIMDIEALGPGYYKLFTKGHMDREISEAMFTIDNPRLAPFNGTPEAMKIAQVIHKWQEISRIAENAAGAWIGKEPGYITRQSHNQEKIAKAGFEAWRDFIYPRLDWEVTADGGFADSLGISPELLAGREKFLRGVYDGVSTGLHEKFNPTGVFTRKPDPLSIRQDNKFIAKKASELRILRFKSGGDWFDYNKKFGSFNLRDSIYRGLVKSAQDTALMKVLGPSPQANLDNLIGKVQKVLKSREDIKGLDKLRKQTITINNQMKELDGTVNIAGNPTLATVGRSVRIIENMAKLGGAVITGWSDVPGFALEMKYQGYGFFKSPATGLRGIIGGRGTAEQKTILSQCGVFFDSMTGNILGNLISGDGIGRLTALQNLYFRASFLSIWTDVFKKSACLMMSHGLAQNKALAFNQLNKKLARALGLYGIDEGRWDMMRSAKTRAADGRDYLTPEGLREISPQQIEAYMRSKGMLVSAQRIEAFREEMIDQWRSYFKDRTQYAMLEPDARTGATMHQGTQGGTIPGEMMRFLSQFKSFPFVFIQRSFGREIYGHGADSLGRGLLQMVKPLNGELTGLASLILSTTIFGYMSMTAKHLLAGKTPRDFTESPEAFGKVFIASLVQGGALGIYGDFLFGEASRNGGSFAESMCGPAVGSAGDIMRFLKKVMKGEDISGNMAFKLFNHLPGNNLFYLRPVLDNAIMYSFYEMINPGFVERTRKRMEKETNQTFYRDPHIWDWAKVRGERIKAEHKHQRKVSAKMARQEKDAKEGKGGFLGPVI